MTQAANLGALGTNAGTTGILPAAGGGTGTASGVTGFKNRIINGAMVIDQRNAGASVTPTTANTTYSVDRYTFLVAQNSKLTAQQNAGSVTPPTGFTNYLGVTSSSAYTVGVAEFFSIQQSIEGFNTADLDFGKATAKTITLSFQVYSSLTGTFGGSLRNSDSSRSYPFSYSIPVANTWTSISITIAGDTTGTWLTTNGIGIKVGFSLGAGSTYSGTAGSWSANNYFSVTGATSVVGTNGATFYITGVQLEVGSTATSFDYRPYGTELALCQRYYEVQTAGSDGLTVISAVYAGSTNNRVWQTFAVLKRATPTISLASGAVWAGALGAGGPTINPSISGVSYSGSDYFVAYNPSAKTVQASAEL
jgi:hypothetical protein